MRKALFICGLCLAASAVARAQQINPRVPPPPPPADAKPADPPVDPKTPPAANPSAAPGDSSSAAASAPEDATPIDPSKPPPPPPETPPEDVFDPLHAERSFNVGTFYLKQGHYDAAIDRLLESAHYEPSVAKPWKALGEAYEKKEDLASAIEAYKKYLQMLPDAPEAAKLQKHVVQLEEKAATQASKVSTK